MDHPSEENVMGLRLISHCRRMPAPTAAHCVRSSASIALRPSLSSLSDTLQVETCQSGHFVRYLGVWCTSAALSVLASLGLVMLCSDAAIASESLPHRRSPLMVSLEAGQSSAAHLPSPGVSLAQKMTRTVLSQPAATEAAVRYLFVDSNRGSDDAAGTQTSPWRSLTQALSQAQPGTTIVLAPGTYSAETGEQFPIRLKPGVTVWGNPDANGRDVLIRGGGIFISPTAARQNIALLAVTEATLIGVTVTNPNARGYGVWVESSSPVLRHNTFRDNRHDGVSVTGDSAPLIQHNIFLGNEANGVSVFGRSSPRIQQNVLSQTGYGVNVADQAQPVLVSNRIANNRSGVVVQESARPVLRHNLIEGNQQSGVVAIAQAQPDLGTPESPGHNQFAQNGEADINAEVASVPVVAVGNQLDSERLLGAVDLTGSMPLAAAREATPLPLDSGPVSLAAATPSEAQATAAPQPSISLIPTSATTTSAPRAANALPTPSAASALPLPSPASLARFTPNQTASSPSSPALTEFESSNSTVAGVSSRGSSRFPQPDWASSATAQSTRRRSALAIEDFIAPAPESAGRRSTSETALAEAQLPAASSSTSNRRSDLVNPNLASARIEAAEVAQPIVSAVPPSMQASTASSGDRSARPSTPQSSQSPPPTTGVLLTERLLSRLRSPSTQPSAPTPENETDGIPIRVIMPYESTPRLQSSSLTATQSPASTALSFSQPQVQPQPQAPTQADPHPTIRPRNQNLLPVPSAEVPYGYVGNRPRIQMGDNPIASRIGPDVSRIQMLGLRYRVLVEANGREAEAIVRSLAPGAFWTQWHGRSLMQAGAYARLENANDMARRLARQGLRAQVQQIQ